MKTEPRPATVVLGTAIGYTAQQIAPFLRSLHNSGYDGDVVLWVDQRDLHRLRADPVLSRAILRGASNWLPLRFPRLRNGRAERWIWRPLQALLWLLVRACGALPQRFGWPLQVALGGLLYAPTESRFLRYCAWVRSSRYDRILLSDVRDVLFQSDPFASLPADGLAISMEVPDYTVGTEKWNRSRVSFIYGEEVLGQVAAFPVSCSGVTAGDRISMQGYLDLMSRDILDLSRHAARQGWFDQAIHNVVLRTRWSGTLQGMETLQSAIATLGAVRDHEVPRDGLGRILNRDSTLVSIVHQYDRLPSFKLALPHLLGG